MTINIKKIIANCSNKFLNKISDEIIKNKKKREESKKKNKGFFTNSISRIYKQKENYSHVHTHVPGESVPSYKILLRLIPFFVTNNMANMVKNMLLLTSINPQNI